MINRHMKRYLILLIFKEMQIKITVRYFHLTTVIKAVIRKSANKKHWRVYEKKELSYTVGRNVNWYNHYGEQHGGSL